MTSIMHRCLKTSVSVLLSFVMLLMPVTATAYNEIGKPRYIERQVFYINPLYADDAYGTAFETSETDAQASDSYVFRDIESAGAYVKSRLINRDVTFSFTYSAPNMFENYDAIIHAVMDEAVKHTGVPNEGDYLRSNYVGWTSSASGYDFQMTYTLTMKYASNAMQEKEMDEAVKALLDSLDLNGKGEYEKIRAIYDWVCENVTYDFDNLNDSSYWLKHSAYATLVNRTSVCQGYAGLIYRLMLEVGIDCRYIGGTSSGGSHGWNIVRIGDLYYNLDATWDAGNVRYGYSFFLKCDNNFLDHYREEKSSTAEFYAAFPMSGIDYHIHTPAAKRVNVKSPICTEKGYTGDLLCKECGEIAEKGEDIPALGHDYGTGDVCRRCGHLKAPYISGDINDDEEVDILDAVALVQYIFDGSAENLEKFIESAADVNGDGEIDILDAVYLVDLIFNS